MDTKRAERALRGNWSEVNLDQPQTPFYPAVQPSTLQSYKLMLNRWDEFRKVFPGAPEISSGEQLPSIGVLRGFVRWLSVSSEGKLDEYPTKSTILSYWSTFRLAVERKTYQKFANDVRLSINDYITKDFTTDGEDSGLKDSKGNRIRLTDKCKPKPFVGDSEIRVMLECLWKRTNDFLHERMRVQLALVILIIMYTAGRPGAVVESNSHRKTNQVLKYGHFRLGLANANNNKPKFVLGLTFEYRKGMRWKQKDFPESVLTEKTFDFGLGLDPIALFLALAFADKAIVGVSGPEQLLDMLAGHEGELGIKWLEWSPEVIDKPPFRQCGIDHKISDTMGLTYDSLIFYWNGLREDSGFLTNFTPYSVRRYVGAAAAASVTNILQLMDVMGHVGGGPKTYQKYYRPTSTSVDIQSIVLGEAQETSIMSEMRDKAKRSRKPVKLTSADMQKIWDSPEMKPFSKKKQEMLLELKSRYRTLKEAPKELKRQYKNIYSKMRAQRIKLEKAALNKRRENAAPYSGPVTLFSSSNTIALSAQRRMIAQQMFGHPAIVDKLGLLKGLVDICSTTKPNPKRFKQLASDPSTKPSTTIKPGTKPKQDERLVEFQCLWGACWKYFADYPAYIVAQHIDSHIRKSKSTCRWDKCCTKLPCNRELKAHLDSAHAISATSV